jgi:hypothetical protein
MRVIEGQMQTATEDEDEVDGEKRQARPDAAPNS